MVLGVVGTEEVTQEEVGQTQDEGNEVVYELFGYELVLFWEGGVALLFEDCPHYF